MTYRTPNCASPAAWPRITLYLLMMMPFHPFGGSGDRRVGMGHTGTVGSHFSHSSCQFTKTFAGPTTIAGKSAGVATMHRSALSDFPTPISSAMNARYPVKRANAAAMTW